VVTSVGSQPPCHYNTAFHTMVVLVACITLSFLILYHCSITTEMCTNHTCTALPCITMCSLSHVAGDTQIWAVLCYIIYMTCAQCASIIPVIKPQTTRHMNIWRATSTYSWEGRYKIHLMKSLLLQCLVDALCIHKQCHWDQVQAV
jgi:hypothetical protein